MLFKNFKIENDNYLFSAIARRSASGSLAKIILLFVLSAVLIAKSKQLRPSSGFGYLYIDNTIIINNRRKKIRKKLHLKQGKKCYIFQIVIKFCTLTMQYIF